MMGVGEGVRGGNGRGGLRFMIYGFRCEMVLKVWDCDRRWRFERRGSSCEKRVNRRWGKGVIKTLRSQRAKEFWHW